MEITDNIKRIEICSIVSMGWEGDAVTYFGKGYDVTVGVESKDEAKWLFKEAGIEWHYS